MVLEYRFACNQLAIMDKSHCILHVCEQINFPNNFILAFMLQMNRHCKLRQFISFIGIEDNINK